MKFKKLIILDECTDSEILEHFRLFEIPFISISERYSGIDDVEVLEITNENKAFLITEDKDFGDLVFRLDKDHYGILLLRFTNNYDQKTKAQTVLKIILEKFEELDNNFSVLDQHKLRIKKQSSKD